MLNKIKNYLLIASTLFAFFVPSVASISTAYAASCSNIANNVSQGANGAAAGTVTSNCDTNSGVGGNDLASVASKIVNIFSIIVGAVAIIMIIYGGFRYITSGGTSERVGGAKNTLIYAVIGLIIVALAQLIVHFVLNTASSSVPTTQ